MFELAIYSWKRCKRLVLNKENKGKEQICLSRTEYKIHEDVILELKQEGPEAMLSIASGQNLVSDGELVFEYALGEENVFSVFTGYGQELVILVNKRESVIAPLQKYYSSMVGRLRAGAAADNDFVIDHPLVSGHHMEISRAYEAMISYHTGIQLGGNAMEAAYFDFSHLTYTEQNKGYKAGIGMIPRDNDESGVEKVIIPQYRKRDV